MSPQEIDDHNFTFRDCSFVARREAQKELAHFEVAPLAVGGEVVPLTFGPLYPDHGGRDPVGAAEMETLGRLYARAMHRIGELEKELEQSKAEAGRALDYLSRQNAECLALRANWARHLWNSPECGDHES